MPLPRVLVIGAGAIGGFVGGALAHAGVADVTLVARGAHADALERDGLDLTFDAHAQAHAHAHDAPTTSPDKRPTRVRLRIPVARTLAHASGTFDVVFLAVKAHQLFAPAADAALGQRVHSGTTFVTLQNGIPWFAFLERQCGSLAGTRLRSVDPDGSLERAFPTRQVVGAIAMPACSMPSPGVIVHESGWHLPMSNTNPLRARELQRMMEPAGFRLTLHDDFLEELWVKSLGSAVFNPASALTGATLGQLVGPHGEALVRAAMDEVRLVAEASMDGKTIRVSNEQRMRGAGRLAAHKTSMLQDVEAGKTELEIECIVGAVLEVARLARVDARVPVLTTLYRLVTLKREVMASSAKL